MVYVFDKINYFLIFSPTIEVDPFSVGDELYGSAALLLQKGEEIKNDDIIDAFINQTSAALKRKQVEEELIKSEETFRVFYDNAPTGLYRTTREGKILLANKALIKMLGYTSFDELSTRNLDKGGYEPSYARGQFIEMVEKNGEVKNFEAKWVCKNGKVIIVRESAKVIYDSEGKALYYDGTVEDITVQRRVEVELQKSEERFRNISSSIIDISYSCFTESNGTYKIDWIFGAYEKITGYTNKELIDLECWGKLVIKEDFPSFKTHILDVKPGFSDICELQIKHKNGHIVWIQASAKCVVPEAADTHFLFGSINDITERKQMNEVLRKSEKKYRLLFDQMMSGFALHEIICNYEGKPVDYRFLEVNNSFSAITGLNSQEIIGKTCLEVLPTTEPFWIDSYGEVAITGKTIRFEQFNIALNKHFEVIAYSTQKGQFITIFNDITKRKRTEKDLQKAIAFSESIVDNIPNMIFLKDAKELRFVRINKAGEDLLGYSNEDLLGKNDYDFFPKEQADFFTENDNNVLKDSGILDITEENIQTKNQGTRVLHTRKVAIFNTLGKPEYLLGISEDITERKRIEQDLIKAKEKAEESDLLKSIFLANMSHEIRTPMNGIIGFTELLKEPKLTVEMQKEYINIIEKSGNRMLNIINDIINISKVESGLMEISVSITNINEQIEYIYAFFKPETELKGLHFSFKNSLSARAANIKTDRELIYAILTNLVKNAIKFTDKGTIEFGYILKTASEVGELRRTVHSRSVEPVELVELVELEFFVKDTGIGIRKEHQEIIFERFRQANESPSKNYEGTGLGLPISKAYVNMLGGKIWVESKPGEGSVFYFTIPYNTATEERKENIKNIVLDNTEDSVKKLKILIAEDEKISELFITKVVEKYSRETINVRTGREAVEACRNNPDIDIVLMDINMPEMDGYEATRQIRKFNKTLVIIAQTAYGLTDDREKVIAAGCDDYITKPINKKILIELIKKYC